MLDYMVEFRSVVVLRRKSVMQRIQSIERKQMRDDLPEFQNGDTLKVYFKVVEGGRERTQLFEGIVLKRQGNGSTPRFQTSRSRRGSRH